MNIQSLLNEGSQTILKTLGRFYLNNKQGLAFLASTLPKIKKGMQTRDACEREGLHIPPFLIASIASECNLFCAGCYARCGGACAGNSRQKDLTAEEWRAVFEQASALGVSFILLAGGEPLLRRDVVQAALPFSNMLFPLFTNGLLLDAETIMLLNRHRHIIPVLSIEGGKAETDARRGGGVYSKIADVMQELKAKKMLFGVSVTVTSRNLDTILSCAFAENLREKGCGLIIFTEYVPMEKDTEPLMLSQTQIKRLNGGVNALRNRFADTIVLAFPGDEAAIGGCLASGRGFFHISPSGGAEPCPFSPYSKYNVKETPMLDILRSPCFAQLQALAAAEENHAGGCVLFRKQEEVQAILRG